MTYIKKLVIHGFKSFPRKTEIPFTKGINIIVGPNGSGKSNISDAICFGLGRLSTKSIRAAKAGNLIFLGTKSLPPSKEAYVEILFDNSERTFSYETDEISIKRIVRKNGQSIYKINNETKTRQDILSLLSQAGIDPYGFNIVLQGGIQNFVRMQSEERRKVIEGVSGIAVYESQKEKSLRELEKTDEKLKEISSVLRERANYLANLEKERQQALRYKKLENDLKKFKASIIYQNLQKKRKELDRIISEITKKTGESEKIKKIISEIEEEIKNFELKIQKINLEIKRFAGIEQESLNREIVDLRADLAGIKTKIENYESRFSYLSNQKKEIRTRIEEAEKFLSGIKKEPPSSSKKIKEINEKKKELEIFEEKRKKFYMLKSEHTSLNERVQDKKNLIQNYENELNFIVRQIEAVSIEILDSKSSKDKLDKLKLSISVKKNSLNAVLKREIELEKISSSSESEIESQRKIIGNISKLDVCPVCKSKITASHMSEIKKEIEPKINSLKKEIENSDRELKEIYQKKEILTKDIEDISQQISKTESDINKLNILSEKKSSMNSLNGKINETKKNIEEMIQRKEKLKKLLDENSNIEEKYGLLKIEIQEISLRTRENIDPEIEAKKREIERLKISLKQIAGNEEEITAEKEILKKTLVEKEKILTDNKKQEEGLRKKFEEIISQRDIIYSDIKKKESEIFSRQHEIKNLENDINEFRINKARIDAESESFESEMSEFTGVEIIKASMEILSQRVVKIQEILSGIGGVNMRSLEVYDAVKKEYDSIKEKSEIILKEKEGIMKIISEIDTKKKRTFFQTMKKLNELMTRNFSQLSTKGEIFLELENRDNPFEAGTGVQIIVKTGHGKYFDVKSLSGGEQTLVALSLIFAIQEHNPYYFYLFDEIDAALDKKNSERLAGLLNKYMLKGQYIVITHNDEVISRATNIYGVTMPMQDGISKITSIRV